MLTRRGLLAGAGLSAASLAFPRLLRAGAESSGCRFVLVTAFGGWDVAYGLDPKPGSGLVDGPESEEAAGDPDDREEVATWGEISAMTNLAKRPAVGRFLDAWADRCVLVRGIDVGSVAHDVCLTRILTGTVTDARADMAAIAGAVGGPALPVPYMDLGGVGRFGQLAASSGRTGVSNQIRQLLDRTTRLDGPSGLQYPLFVPDAADEPDVDAWLESRRARFAARAHQGRGAGRVDALYEAADRAEALRVEGRALARGLSAFARQDLRGQFDVALDLFTSGLAQSVSVDSAMSWDTHTDTADQHAAYQTLFSALNRFVGDLDDAGMLDDTVIAVVSEMSRTPRRNGAGGKDHWPVTSALFLGGPLAGGRVLGGTDDGLVGLTVDTATGRPDPGGRGLRYDHVVAGLLAAMDVDPGPWLPDAEVLGGFTG